MTKLAILALTAATAFAADFTGVITDSMCKLDHKMMNITPDEKCVQDCVKAHAKYILVADGKEYKLSDQETPAKFAAKKVKVSGTLFPKTGVIKVDKIEAAR